MWYGSCCGKFSLPLARQESRTNSLSVITSCPGWGNKYTWKMALSFPRPAFQHSAHPASQHNTIYFGWHFLCRIITNCCWVDYGFSHAKLRIKESTGCILTSWVGKVELKAKWAGLYFAVLEEWLTRQKVGDLETSMWCLAGESRRNKPGRCGRWDLEAVLSCTEKLVREW